MIGKGLFGAKDFTFGVSVVTLILPLLTEIEFSPTDDFIFPYEIIFLGMMTGSMLTITNISSIIFHLFYRIPKVGWKNNILLILRKNSATNGIIEKNFENAIKSPSISYEEDKIITMFYFLIILILVGFNILDNSQLFFNEIQVDKNVSLGTIIILLIIVIIVIIWNIKKTKPNLFDKLSIVTLNLTYNNLIYWNELYNTFQITLTADILSKINKKLSVEMCQKKIKNEEQLGEFLMNSEFYREKLILVVKTHFSNYKEVLEKSTSEIFEYVKGKSRSGIGNISQERRKWYDFYVQLNQFADVYKIKINSDFMKLISNKFFITYNEKVIQPKLDQIQQLISIRDWQLSKIYSDRFLINIKTQFTKYN